MRSSLLAVLFLFSANTWASPGDESAEPAGPAESVETLEEGPAPATTQLNELASLEDPGDLGEEIAVPDVIPLTPPPGETAEDWVIEVIMDSDDFWFEEQSSE